MPAAASTPIQASTENETLSRLELLMGKKPCFWELTVVCLLKTASPLHLEPDYRDAELVGYTQPLLTNVIPWITYEAQNMVEPTFRQELQCMREVNHLRYIIAMLVWFCHGDRNTDHGHCSQHVASRSGLWPWPLSKLE